MHKVICTKCGKTFDRDKIPFIEAGGRRYAHADCNYEPPEKVLTPEEEAKKKLYDYIKVLFRSKQIDIKIIKQIDKYIKDYNYTYSGIHKALIYHFEIQHGSLDKANNSIGIVPYVYNDAYRYYYALWEAQQSNVNKNLEDYIPEVKTIVIPPPEATIKKRKLFTFLEEEQS